MGVSSLVYTEVQITELAHNQGVMQTILQDHETRLTINEAAQKRLARVTRHLTGLFKETRQDVLVNMAIDRFETALERIFDDATT